MQDAGRRPRSRAVSVHDELSHRIEHGQVPAGSKLPAETELAAEFGVSRATLRDALRSLESEGLVRRMQGSGTFVTQRVRVANNLDVNFGVTDAILAAGMRAGSEAGRFWLEPAGSSEAERLGVDPADDVVVMERVRTADGRPVVLSRDIFPERLVRDDTGIVEEMLQGSVYEVFERRLGLVVHHGVASFRPVQADRSLAERLGVVRGDLMLYLWQVDYAETGEALVSSHEYHLADAFDFSVVRRGPGRRLS